MAKNGLFGSFSPGAQMVKNPPAIQVTHIQSLDWKDPLENEWLPTPTFLPGKFQGQKTLVDYSLWCCKGSDMTKRLSLSLSNTGYNYHKKLNIIKILIYIN